MLEEKLQKLISEKGIVIGEGLHGDLLEIMKGLSVDNPQGSFKRLEQLKAASLKDRWCF